MASSNEIGLDRRHARGLRGNAGVGVHAPPHRDSRRSKSAAEPNERFTRSLPEVIISRSRD
jgi:hypothetical protein